MFVFKTATVDNKYNVTVVADPADGFIELLSRMGYKLLESPWEVLTSVEKARELLVSDESGVVKGTICSYNSVYSMNINGKVAKFLFKPVSLSICDGVKELPQEVLYS